jgi:putative Holliday junction resolvase
MIDNMKILGLDYGEQKIGLAIGDLENKIASPYKILVNDESFLEKLKGICLKENIDKIVIGLPLTLKSASAKQVNIVLRFIEKLKKATYLEIVEQDERLSSAYAKSLLKEMKVKHLDDDVAAMIILQSYFDEQKNSL